MERVRLRHQEAEQLIAKAKAQAELREQEMAALRARGQPIPPEASLLGCWQTIEETRVYNMSLGRVPETKLGDFRTYFTALAPDGTLFGKAISSGSIVLTGAHAGKPWPGVSTYAIRGRVLAAGVVKYSITPVQNTEFMGSSAGVFGLGGYVMRRLPMAVIANWKEWELEGTSTNDERGLQQEFKAVRIEEAL